MGDPKLTEPVTFTGRAGEKVSLSSDYGCLLITGNCAALEGDVAEEFVAKAAEILGAAQECEAQRRAARLEADLAAAKFGVLGREATVCCVAHPVRHTGCLPRAAGFIPATGAATRLREHAGTYRAGAQGRRRRPCGLPDGRLTSDRPGEARRHRRTAPGPVPRAGHRQRERHVPVRVR